MLNAEAAIRRGTTRTEVSVGPRSGTLLFTIAHNGFWYMYRSCLRSQAAYCARHGYTYCAVKRPLRPVDPALSAWLKVPLLLGALEAGYATAMFVDADCEVSPSAPALDARSESPGAVAMAPGRSGRLNSGVIVASNGASARGFLQATLSSLTEEISAEDRVQLKYENGNLIHTARLHGGVTSLDQRWNNCLDRGMDGDYIRHYTGPMREDYVAPPAAPQFVRAYRRIGGSRPGERQPSRRSPAFRQELERLAEYCSDLYPALRATPAAAT